MSSDLADQALPESNPFAVLDVTTRDTRERIMEAAEDRALVLDGDVCAEARSILTNPRRRFEAELGWFPGVAPTTAKKAMQVRNVAEIEALPIDGLATANALVAVGLRHPPTTLEGIVSILTAVGSVVDAVSIEPILRDVNEDREISGFPSFTSVDTAEEMLRERIRLWQRGIMSMLSRLPTSLMAEGLYRASETMAETRRFPRFMHDVIEDYALRAQPFLQDEMASAARLVDKAREVAGSRPQALGPLIDGLSELAETWEEVTRPIQLSMTTLGRTDEDGERLGFMIRSLAIDLYNEHSLADEAQRITTIVATRFSALPRLMSKIAEDREALGRFAHEARAQEEKVSYAAEIGTFRKTRLAISSTTLEWKGQTYAVADIRSARWGAVRKSVNGIPTGTDYLIAWSDGSRTATIDFRNGVIYEAFVERLWRVLAKPMLSTMVEGLRGGREFQFGAAVIRDDGLTLPCTKIFGEKRTQFDWSEITIRNADGSFIIEGPAKSKAMVSLSFKDVPNVHFLEALVRAAFSNGCTRLSSAFS